MRTIYKYIVLFLITGLLPFLCKSAVTCVSFTPDPIYLCVGQAPLGTFSFSYQPICGYTFWTTINGNTTGLYTFSGNQTVCRQLRDNFISPPTCDSTAATGRCSSCQVVCVNPAINAGPDFTACATGFNMAAIAPTCAGTNGTWSVIAGGGVTFGTPTSATTLVTGAAAGAHTFRWSVTSVCFDDIVVTVVAAPTVANAGPNQTICTSPATMAANAPAVGTGLWTFIAGPGGDTITTPSSATTSITGLVAGVYTFRWTISNAPCPPSTDDVIITVTGGAPSNPLIWNGNVSTDWFNSANWTSCGIPTCLIDAVIPTGRPFYPVITATATCRNLDIQAGTSSVTLSGSNTLNVCGNWIQAATFTPNTGKVRFVGTVAQTHIRNTGAAGNFYDVEMANSLGAAGGLTLLTGTATSDMVITNVLTLTNGLITTGTNQVQCTSNLTGAATVGSTVSYVNGYLRRAVTNSISYDFPVGHLASGKGYQLANVFFNAGGVAGPPAANRIDYLVGWFSPYGAVPASPAIFPTPCATAGLVVMPALDNGEWTINAFNSSNSALAGTIYSYNITLSPLNYTNLQAYRSVMRNSSIAMGTAPACPSYIRNTLTGFSTFGIGQAAVVLPVELISFTSSWKNNDAVLNWVTASEQNSKGFDIERSFSGSTIWEKIGFVASGNGNYTFSDANIQSKVTDKVFYRLKQVDNDGNTKLSNTVELVSLNENATNLRIVPNPTIKGSTVNLQYQLTENGSVTIGVYDLTGKLVLSKENITQTIGNQKYSLDANNLAIGTYILRLTSASGLQSTKFVVE